MSARVPMATSRPASSEHVPGITVFGKVGGPYGGYFWCGKFSKFVAMGQQHCNASRFLDEMTLKMPDNSTARTSRPAPGLSPVTPGQLPLVTGSGRDAAKSTATSASCVTLAGRRLSWGAMRLRADGRSVNQLTAWLGGGAARSSIGRWLTGEVSPRPDSLRACWDRLGIHPRDWTDFGYLPWCRYTRTWRTHRCELSVYATNKRGGDDEVTQAANATASATASAMGLPTEPTIEFVGQLWRSVHAELVTLPERLTVEFGFARPTAVHKKVCTDIADDLKRWTYAIDCTSAAHGLRSVLAVFYRLGGPESNDLLTLVDALSRRAVPELATFAADYWAGYPESRPTETELLALGDGVQ